MSATQLARGVVLSALLVAAACSKDTTAPAPPPADPWLGTWTLVSINGTPVPTDFTVSGWAERTYSRTLQLVAADQTGRTLAIWRDSSLSALLCNPPSSNKTTMCNASGKGTAVWATSGDTLNFIADRTSVTGYVVTFKTFVKQKDGTLLKNDDSQTEVYRRQ